MTDVFSLYKPLRNYLKDMDLENSLLAIHAHTQFQQFKAQLPQYIIGDPYGYRKCIKFIDFVKFNLMCWELATIYKELVLNAEGYQRDKSFLNWYYLSKGINKLKYFENEMAKIYSSKENVLIELFRIAHRQFKWQSYPSTTPPARYWKIYSNKALEKIIIKTIGLNVEEIIKIGMSLLGVYQSKIALYYPPVLDLSGITKPKLDVFLRHFSIDLKSLKENIKKEQKYDEKFIYTYSSCIAYPIIRMNWGGRLALVCPIPRYLYNRITDGIYYEICNTDGFDNSFGNAFQEYVGDYLSSVYKSGHIYSERFYKKNKRTSDWIIEDKSSRLFIECKTKRLTVGAKACLFDLTELENELSKIADAVIQVYKTFNDFQKGEYPHLKYDTNKKNYAIVVTLEEWFIFGDIITSKLDQIIIEKMLKLKLSKELLITCPYCIVSIETFESLSNILNKNEIIEVMEEKTTDSDKRRWDMNSYLLHKYPDDWNHITQPFVSELNKRIENMIENNNETV